MVAFIVVPKNGGLQEYREKALSSLQNVNSSKIIEVRGEDVPFWVEEFRRKGKKAIGLTGGDLYEEYCLRNTRTSLRVIGTLSWADAQARYGKPALCLVGPRNKNFEDFPKNLTVCVAAKYKSLGKKYLNFLEQNGYTFQKKYVSGCVELSCDEGIADLVIDIVYTGSTLLKFGLDVYDIITQSDFVILGGEVKK